jgi:Ran GTPase-activating protein (RanGAP) involved in mRNA processing and transport
VHLHRSLHKLDLSRDTQNARKFADVRRLETATTLKQLLMGSSGLRNSHATAIGGALATHKSLLILSLEANDIRDDGMKALAEGMEQNASLTTLNLSRNRFRLAGLETFACALKKNKTLVTLNLVHNQIGDLGAAALAGALQTNTTLRNLDLDYNRIGNPGARSLRHVLTHFNSTLSKLSLMNNDCIDDAVKLHIHVLVSSNSDGACMSTKSSPRISIVGDKLDLSYNPGKSWQFVDLRHLEATTKLTQLLMDSSGLRDNHATALARALATNKSLLILSLEANEIRSAGMKALAQGLELNASLVTLNASRNQSGSAGAVSFAKALKTNSTLVRLNLGHNNIGDMGAAALADALQTNTTLRDLDLDSNRIGTRGATSLRHVLANFNSTLSELRLWTNYCIDDAVQLHIRVLASSNSVGARLIRIDEKELDLTSKMMWCYGTSEHGWGMDQVARELAFNTTITKLILNNNKMSYANSAALASALTENRTVQAIHLDNCIDGPGFLPIAESLCTNNTLTELFLNRNSSIGWPAGADVMEALTKFLQTNTCLQVLGMGRSYLDRNWGVAIARGLECNVNLSRLYLEDNDLGDSGTSAIAAALQGNTTLQRLALNGNRISLAGATALAATLRGRACLQVLQLGRNSFDEASVAVLAEALKTNTTLARLGLDSNHVSDTGAIAIAAALRKNTGLKQLALHDNIIGRSGAAAILKALKSNFTLSSLKLHRNRSILPDQLKTIDFLVTSRLVLNSMLNGIRSPLEEGLLPLAIRAVNQRSAYHVEHGSTHFDKTEAGPIHHLLSTVFWTGATRSLPE